MEWSSLFPVLQYLLMNTRMSETLIGHFAAGFPVQTNRFVLCHDSVCTQGCQKSFRGHPGTDK